MLPSIASIIDYIATSTGIDKLRLLHVIFLWIGDEGRSTSEGNEVCKSTENFHVELQFGCQQYFYEEYIGTTVTGTEICMSDMGWIDVCG